MDKALTFFRVFDLAFFAPGTILLVVGHYLLVPETVHQAKLSTAEALVTILGFVAAAFCIGLVIHATVWTIFKPILTTMGKKTDDPPSLAEDSGLAEKAKTRAASEEWTSFPDHFEGTTRIDLILYFWYLRATCWNVAFALATSSIFALCSAKLDLAWVRYSASSGFAFGAVTLCLLGTNYHRTLQKSLESNRRNQFVSIQPED